jgi:4-amino-4-deoxy-L-arabinose transferase-like glycosyltransferase
MEYAIVALMEVAVVIVGLIPPVAACILVCSFSGINKPSIKKTLLIVIAGLVISTFIEMIIRRYIALPDLTSIFIFCMSLLIAFTILWQAYHKMTPRQAVLLAGVIMIVVLIYTVTVPPQFNAYALLRAGMWWLVNH